MRDGKIAAVGASLQAPADAAVVDGTGKWVTPGIIDAHSHLGVYPSPGVDANADFGATARLKRLTPLYAAYPRTSGTVCSKCSAN